MKWKTTPEAILSRFVRCTLNLGRLNTATIQRYLISDVEATIRRTALPGLGPAVREWAYSAVKLRNPMMTRNVDEIVYTLLEDCRIWEDVLIGRRLPLVIGRRRGRGLHLLGRLPRPHLLPTLDRLKTVVKARRRRRRIHQLLDRAPPHRGPLLE